MSKIAVSMQDFLRTGEFGPVSLGLTRRQLRDCLGNPEDWGPYPKAEQHAAIWKYGDVEFFFHFQEDALGGIFADHIGTLKGGGAIDLDPWVLSGNLTVKQALRDFDGADISCDRIDWTFDDTTERFRVGVGVELIFVDPRYDSDPEKELRPLAPADMTFHGFSHSASAKRVMP